MDRRISHSQSVDLESVNLKIKCLFAVLLSSVVFGLSGCSNDASVSGSTQTDAAGSAAGAATPPSDAWQDAVIQLPATPEEKRFVHDVRCFDDSCMTAERFDRYIVKTYPDIAKIHYRANRIELEDKASLEDSQMAFRRGLYFAKRIKLANGSTLFDLLATCSHDFEPTDAASVGFDKNDKPFLYLQYIPVFYSNLEGKNVDMNMAYERVGDQLKATGSQLSTTAVVDRKFPDPEVLQCAHGRPKLDEDGHLSSTQ
ncbi:hypothetical protein FSB08_20185 [Paraburkholderia sp. JPY432]|uniref:hypothetical protein n=1 Tax=Paraburkholderia youngii TaxID=2782701 RepID=UPI001595E270|nr:hypothetical protein [Paraburkholderia youngii]NVH74789.1 hypothetical protein [Paraburkholderia youngii]